MSVNVYPTCEACGSPDLNPKLGKGDDVYACECEACGHRADYIMPSDEEA